MPATNELAALKNAIISARILLEIENGKSVQEALDSVCGAGTYDNLVDDLYSTLRGEG